MVLRNKSFLLHVNSQIKESRALVAYWDSGELKIFVFIDEKKMNKLLPGMELHIHFLWVTKYWNI